MPRKVLRSLRCLPWRYCLWAIVKHKPSVEVSNFVSGIAPRKLSSQQVACAFLAYLKKKNLFQALIPIYCYIRVLSIHSHLEYWPALEILLIPVNRNMNNSFAVEALGQCSGCHWGPACSCLDPWVHLQLQHLQEKFGSSVEFTACHTLWTDLTGSALTSSGVIKLRCILHSFPDVKGTEVGATYSWTQTLSGLLPSLPHCYHLFFLS